MWLRAIALLLSVFALAVLLASGPGTRLGLWDWRTGLGLLRYGAYLGIAAAIVSILGLSIRRFRSRVLAASLVIGLAAFVPPFVFQQQARAVPPINDISTDAPSAAQREAYPDIQPIALKEKAFERSLGAAQALGWEIVRADPQAGTIEAVDTTFWFGFKDDVLVRVAPAAPGSRVDVRSKSRVGRGDAGTNARRIRGFRAEVLK
jgi:uncharacterized protein (DUF1499 family)